MSVAETYAPQHMSFDFAQYEQDSRQEQPLPRPSQPNAIIVPTMPEEVQARADAERIFRAAGSLATKQEVEMAEFESERTSKNTYATIVEMIYAAAEGDPQAIAALKANVRADIIERSIKAGHTMHAELNIGPDGQIMQHNQTMRDVYINALRWASATPGMRARAEAETRNGSRIEELLRQGMLDDAYFVVISRCADDMALAEAKKAGFFVDTMSCVIQTTHRRGNTLLMDSHFVAGTTHPGAARHDQQTITKVAAKLGIDLAGKNATQMLDTPLLIHKSLLPGGSIDLVKMYDEAAGGTFYGEDKPAYDYDEYLAECRKLELELEPIVTSIVQTLMQESIVLDTPLLATKRLAQLSQQKMVDQAIRDERINPHVFGAAAEDIKKARVLLRNGDHDAFLESREKAQDNATSSSCPTAEVASDSKGKGSGDGASAEGGESSAESLDPNAPLRCPKCEVESPRRTVVQATCWACPHCKFKVDICTAQTLNPGNTEKVSRLYDYVINTDTVAKHINELFGIKKVVSVVLPSPQNAPMKQLQTREDATLKRQDLAFAA